MKEKAAWHQRVKVNGTDDSKVVDDSPSDNAKLGQQVAEGCYLLVEGAHVVDGAQ